MSSLLSPFNFGQKHAYFHARITIHELANVPLIDGSFKTRWRVKNSHSLQSLPASHGDDTTTAGSEEGGGGGGGGSSERRTLQHKKSFASSIASQDAKDSPKSDQHPIDEKEHRERKTSHRFLSGFKDVLGSKARRPRESLDERPLSDTGGEGKSGKRHSTAMQRDATAHSKAESYDSLSLHRPRRTASFNDSASVNKMTSMSGKADDKDGHIHSSSLIHAEPRGETSNEKIKEHHVKWEKTFDVGVRIPVVKNRLADKTNSGNNAQLATASGALSPSSGPGHPSGTISSEGGGGSTPGGRTSMSSSMSDQRSRSMAESRASEGESRADKLDKEVKEKDKDREMVDVWGMLGNTELKLTVRADISTERLHHKDPESHVTMGYVTINLAELAPYPESSAHQHHSHHSHHHHHHHHLHHHHHHPSPTLYRADARRYLLVDSRNNATLKVTVEMTHVGGTKEYAVPAARKGLLVAGAASLMNDINKAGDGSSNSEASHSTEGNFNDAARPGLGDHRHSGLPDGSITSFKQDQMSAWPTNSVARHGRIPSSNLKTELSHQEAARAVKEAGGQRMGFSFGAGAHHERPPEDVIEALFNPGPSKMLSQMLTPYNSRSDKPKSSSLSPKKKKDRQKEKKDVPKEQQTDGDQVERGIYPEKPPHYDGISPAEHPKDSAQSKGEALTRFPSEIGEAHTQPGPDLGQSSLLAKRRASKSSAEYSGEDISKKPPSHRRNSSNGTVKSILTNSMTPKTPSVKAGTAMTHSTSSGPSSYDHAADIGAPKSSQSSSASTRVNLVHWDANIDHGKEETPPVPSVPSPITTGGLTVAAPHLTASPRAMSRDISEDSLFPVKPGKGSSLPRTPSTMFEEDEDDLKQHYRLTPPSTPPDVSQKEKDSALDSRSVMAGIEKAPSSKGQRGLTKEEALKQGYRGAGWGTINWLWASPIIEATDVYTDSPSPHFQLSRDAVQ